MTLFSGHWQILESYKNTVPTTILKMLRKSNSKLNRFPRTYLYILKLRSRIRNKDSSLDETSIKLTLSYSNWINQSDNTISFAYKYMYLILHNMNFTSHRQSICLCTKQRIISSALVCCFAGKNPPGIVLL